ncbi:unnamed protein product [Symbiodinium sp. KB8]|nr:unnamed protein product [Symbiodinium sp. KB8]
MPTTHTSRHEGVELALRRGNEQAAQMLVPAPGDGAVARPSRRRSTLADMRKDLEGLEQQPRWRWRAKVALVFYTFARITMNLPFTERKVWDRIQTEEGMIYYQESSEKRVDFNVVCDAVCRPLVTGFGLYMFVHRLDRFSWSNQLQLLSFITMCCLALPLCDESVEPLLRYFFRERYDEPGLALMLCWEVLCNVLQVYMTILKLGALGWHRTARCCCVLTTLGVCLLAAMVLVFLLDRYQLDIMWRPWFCCCFTVLAIQCWALCCAASRAMEQARGNDSIWWTACLLYANACLVPLGPALSFVGLWAFAFFTHDGLEVPLTLLTLDVTFQLFNALLLSGMVGTISMNLEDLQRLAELAGFGLASARVAFPGHISQSATDCVVSFPGKYSDLWDTAVSSVTQQDTFSLACVFLTDAASGLGRHADNPDTPGSCWCRQIYGPLPAATYLSVVQISADESQNHNQTLAFKRADAEAMGQRLLIKQHQGDIEWEQELAGALQDAEARCVKNQYRAPWGCQWFEKWKQNVDRAAELHQTLHVFYFEDSKGQGKMPWELLANERAKHEARKNSGLGASQTAEVAYLDKIGLSYVEHDIMEFAAFLSSRTVADGAAGGLGASLRRTSLAAWAPESRGCSVFELRVIGDGAVARPSRRRSTLAEMRKDLEDLEQQPRWRWRAKVALVFYTFARITMNLPFTERKVWDRIQTEEGMIYYQESSEKRVDFHVVCDAICRPLVAGFGLYMFVHRLDRFSCSNQLQLLSFITTCCLALPLCDESVEHLLSYFLGGRMLIRLASTPCWEVLCNVLQVYMTILKLGALRWHRTARCCCVLTTLGVCLLGVSLCLLLVTVLSQYELVEGDELYAIMWSICFGCCFTVVGIQCRALCCAASRAMEQARGNDPIWWTACLLYANACLVALGPALSFVGLFAFSAQGENILPLTCLTLDVTFQVFNVLLLSGMVGTNSMNLEALQRLAELSGFGLASARVAFPGHISQSATDCVVSFPGKYSDLWDKAVSSVTQQDTFSLACVFLTDTASGLGRHAINPNTPGNCWCRQIYGPVPAATYLSVVQVSADESQNHDQTLAFKRADAEAMGQRLLIKKHQGDVEWEQELAEALQDAEVRCVENQCRAPWGCQWFEKWKQNVDRAAELHQTLHVFYFEHGKGKGKLPWELLANERARHDARKTSGLGASQTAEVAYLDKIGLSYVEHDIMEFAAFLTSRTVAAGS